ncbi:hypothetical protein Tco_1345429 [Tanacetum coccineum]
MVNVAITASPAPQGHKKSIPNTSELVEGDEEEDEEDEEVEESSDSDSESEDAEDDGPIAGDEGPTAGEEGLATGDEGPSMRLKSLGLGGDAVVPESHLRDQRVLALRQPTLTTWIDPEDGIAYIDVPAYPPPAPPVQTPPSPEWSSGSLHVSPTPHPSVLDRSLFLTLVESLLCRVPGDHFVRVRPTVASPAFG